MRKIAIITGLLCLSLGVFDVPNFARIKQTGFGNIEVSIQTDKEKIKDNLNNIKNIKDNSKNASLRTVGALKDLASSVKENKADLIGTIEDYNEKTDARESLSRRSQAEIDILDKPDAYSLEDVQGVIEDVTGDYADLQNIEDSNINFFKKDQLENEQGQNIKASDTTAFSDRNEMYFEADKINQDDELIHSIGHENKRQNQLQDGLSNNTNDGLSTQADKEALKAGDHIKQAFELEKRIKKVDDYEYTKYTRNQADFDLIDRGSKKASKVENVQPYMGRLARDIVNSRYNMSVEEYVDTMGDMAREDLEKAGKVGKVVMIEMPFSPISPGDYMRIGLGKDPYTGKELSTEEYIDSVISFATPIGFGKGLSSMSKMFKINSNKIKELPPLVDSLSDVKKGLEQTQDE